MGRRGDVLHEHILDTAKVVFSEYGFERTSMDAIAAAAATSKRSLYAHFPNKDALFLACIERSHELFQGRLPAPARDAADVEDAVARYCARFRVLLGYAPIVRMCRLGVAEAQRLPKAAARIQETFVKAPQACLAAYFAARLDLSEAEAGRLAERVLGVTVFPTLLHALFGLTQLVETMPDEVTPSTDLPEVRAEVTNQLRTAQALDNA